MASAGADGQLALWNTELELRTETQTRLQVRSRPHPRWRRWWLTRVVEELRGRTEAVSLNLFFLCRFWGGEFRVRTKEL